MNCDDDIATMSVDELRREVQKLRDAIRQQRDQKGHDLCWYIPELWDVLPERTHPSLKCLSGLNSSSTALHFASRWMTICSNNLPGSSKTAPRAHSDLV